MCRLLALYDAAMTLFKPREQLMKQLLADPSFPPNKPVQMPNSTIYIPLHVAIMTHNTAAEKLLLEAGAACRAAEDTGSSSSCAVMSTAVLLSQQPGSRPIQTSSRDLFLSYSSCSILFLQDAG
jgi:ankyrin repeat protein